MKPPIIKWQVGLIREHGTFNPDHVYAIDADGAEVSVCQVYGVPMHVTLEELLRSGNASDAEGMTNARRIAAVPELLEIAKLTVGLFETTAGKHTAAFYGRGAQALVNRARAVIAQVEGKVRS